MQKPLHLDFEWLRTKYVVEKLSTYEIAKIVHRDPKRIYEKLIDFGIPTRKRGENLKGKDNFMLQPNAVNPFLGKKHSLDTLKTLSQKASQPKLHLRGERNGMYNRTGKSNPNYKDGISPERQRVYASSEWKSIVRSVLERDGHRCVKCSSLKNGKRGLHTHHVKSWESNKDARLDPLNIITLCRKCHEWVHSKDNINQEFIEKEGERIDHSGGL